LKTAGVAINEIARRVGVASSTVRLTLKRLTAAGLGWPLPGECQEFRARLSGSTDQSMAAVKRSPNRTAN
jgi:transposase-like protein